ncbi:disease resistance protein Roq1-like [Nymphaea colorata]|uniref:disease resistance protein Roq1-like n=1 Tax=Nymphaea colorata TaxID=210225 RepID=UPI00129E5960|nr:disease resistance protein Roq1-like [Nymphaea colorata]
MARVIAPNEYWHRDAKITGPARDHKKLCGQQMFKVARHMLASLQLQIITELLNDKHSTITDLSQGTNLIERRIHSRRVIIIIDDVDDHEQLKELVGSRSWFCHGSRIIITTRYKHVLNVHGLKEEEIYELQSLTPRESLELFSLHAFGTATPFKEYA